MELFAKIVNSSQLFLLTIFEKRSVLDVSLGSDYVFVVRTISLSDQSKRRDTLNRQNRVFLTIFHSNIWLIFIELKCGLF